MRNFLVACLGLLGLWSTSWATTFLERPFPDSLQKAPTVVRGIVGKKASQWTELKDGSKRIYTYYTLQVTEVLKGQVEGGTLQFREIGGSVGGIGMRIAGTAEFDTGEDVVVFLGEKDADASYPLLEMMMGKYSLEKDANGEEHLVGAGMGGGHAHADHPGGMHPEGEEVDKKPQKIWTMAAVRELIVQQSGKTSAQPHEKGKEIQPTPTPTLDGAPQSAPTAPAAQAAGETISQEEGFLFSPGVLWGGAVVLGLALGLWFWLRRSA